MVSGLARGISSTRPPGGLGEKWPHPGGAGLRRGRGLPAENLKLYQEIPAHGALVSEFPLGDAAEARNFPIRNRIISGRGWGGGDRGRGEKRHRHQMRVTPLDEGREVFASLPIVLPHQSNGAAPPHPGWGQAGPGRGRYLA